MTDAWIDRVQQGKASTMLTPRDLELAQAQADEQRQRAERAEERVAALEAVLKQADLCLDPDGFNVVTRQDADEALKIIRAALENSDDPARNPD